MATLDSGSQVGRPGSTLVRWIQVALSGTMPVVAQAVVVVDPATGDAPSPYLPAGTDRSGSITAGGTAQVMAPANASRKKLTGQNVSSGDIWINEIGGAAVVGAAGSYKITSGSSFSINTNRAISIIGATTAQAFTATES